MMNDPIIDRCYYWRFFRCFHTLLTAHIPNDAGKIVNAKVLQYSLNRLARKRLKVLLGR
jgi:hypothetical protein